MDVWTRFIDNEDVLHTVFNELERTHAGSWKRNDRTLASAARVCKAFYNPANRVLWRQLDDMFPLLLLLSSFSVVGMSRNIDKSTEIYMLTDAVHPSEWDRFRTLANHVQKLNSLCGSSLSLSSRSIAPSTWATIKRLAGGNPFLPNLRNLSWVHSSPQSTDVLAFISPSLTHLDIYLDRPSHISQDNALEWRSSVRVLLFSITSTASWIRGLHLRTGDTDTFTFSVASAISKLRSLRRFHCSTLVDNDTLHALADVEGLEELELDTIRLPHEDILSNFRFRSLRKLSIRRHPSDNHFYDVFKSTHSYELTIGHYPAIRNQNIHETCIAWSQCFPFLRTIRCMFRKSRGDAKRAPGQNPTSFSNVFGPLLDLHSIEEVSFVLPPKQIIVRDAEVQAIAEAWPRLTSLVIRVIEGWTQSDISAPQSQPDCAGPASLVSLAMRCPKLRMLRLPDLDLRLDGFSSLAEYPVLDHHLRLFVQPDVHVADIAVSVLLVDRLFPHVFVPQSKHVSTTWDEFERQLNICQMARRQRVPISSDRPWSQCAGLTSEP